MEIYKKTVRITTVIVAVITFLIISGLFVSELRSFRLENNKALKYKIPYPYGPIQYVTPPKKVDPGRVSAIQTKFNLAAAEYFTSIAIIAIISTPLIFVTRRKP